MKVISECRHKGNKDHRCNYLRCPRYGIMNNWAENVAECKYRGASK